MSIKVTTTAACENCNDRRTVAVLDLRLGAWVRRPCEVCSWEEPNGRGHEQAAAA